MREHQLSTSRHEREFLIYQRKILDIRSIVSGLNTAFRFEEELKNRDELKSGLLASSEARCVASYVSSFVFYDVM